MNPATMPDLSKVGLNAAHLLYGERLVENFHRGFLIEAMIEPFLRADGWRYCGANGAGFDFVHGATGTKLELRQSAAWQTWSDARGMASPGSFDIAGRTGEFPEDGSKFVRFPDGPRRSAHVYVFARNEQVGPEANHHDPDQWAFYVVPTPLLPRGQGDIVLAHVQNLAARGGAGPLRLEELAAEVRPTGPPPDPNVPSPLLLKGPLFRRAHRRHRVAHGQELFAFL